MDASVGVTGPALMRTYRNGAIVSLTCGCEAEILLSLAPLVHIHYIVRVRRKGSRCQKRHHTTRTRTIVRRDEIQRSRSSRGSA